MSASPNTFGRNTVDAWRNDFGNAYIERNRATESAIRQRTRILARVLDSIAGRPPESILEVGCNVGINQRALTRFSDAELWAVEPNARARDTVLGDGVLDDSHLFDAVATDLPFDDASMDLVFTSGVLIHVSPDDLDRAYAEIHRVSRRYILSIEYFSQKPDAIRYRGEDGLLFKRDFGRHWLDLYPDLEPVAEGFLWSRTTGNDDGTWWMFRKTGGDR